MRLKLDQAGFVTSVAPSWNEKHLNYEIETFFCRAIQSVLL